MKFKLLIYLLLAANLCMANMASPLQEGTKAASPFSSKDINILSETIFIKIDKDFRTARFIVEYTIESKSAGKQMPLLFFAQDFRDSFFVWVDGQKVPIQNIPEEFYYNANPSFTKKYNLYDTGSKEHDEYQVSISWQGNDSQLYNINELKYFETDISKGIHKVRVEYTANAWTDNSDWIKEYYFRYSLTPAKFWKSFGSLDVVVEQDGEIKKFTTNIGQPAEKEINAKNTWHFNKLPAESLAFTYKPKPNQLAAIGIALEPFGLAVLAGFILFALHIYLVIRYRRNNPAKKNWVVIAGSFIVPFFALLFYIFSFAFIDSLIGEDAGRHHGYAFLIMLFYPVYLLGYWVIMWMIDKIFKRSLLSK